MAGTRFTNPNPQFRQLDEDLIGGSLTFCISGTNTLQATYSDSALTTPNTNPVELNAYGRPETDIFLDPVLTYRCILKDADGVVIWTKDPISGSDLAATIAAHNSDPAAHYAATESQRGFIELANQTEANAYADAQRAVTPATMGGALLVVPTLGMIGPINEFQGANIASAGTLNLNTATGNLVDVTGSATITAITLSQGRERTVRFTGAATLQNGASLVLPGAANIVTAAGDFAIFRGYASGVVRCVSYQRVSGYLPIGTGPIKIGSGNLNTGGDTTLNIPSGAWSSIRLVIKNLRANTNYVPYMRINGDTAGNYHYATVARNENGVVGNQGSAGAATGICIASNAQAVENSSVTQNPHAIELVLYEPANAANRKKIGITHSIFRDDLAAWQHASGGAVWVNVAAIASVQILLRAAGGGSPSGATVNATAGDYYLVGEL